MLSTNKTRRHLIERHGGFLARASSLLARRASREQTRRTVAHCVACDVPIDARRTTRTINDFVCLFVCDNEQNNERLQTRPARVTSGPGVPEPYARS
jgi:hypothetical protein